MRVLIATFVVIFQKAEIMGTKSFYFLVTLVNIKTIVYENFVVSQVHRNLLDHETRYIEM